MAQPVDATVQLARCDRRSKIMVLCNDASLDVDSGVGDPLEVALLRAGRLAGLERQRPLPTRFHRLREEAFDASTRMMASFHAIDERSASGGQRRGRKSARGQQTRSSNENGQEAPLTGEQGTGDAGSSRRGADGGRRYAGAVRSPKDGIDCRAAPTIVRQTSADLSHTRVLIFLGLVALYDPPQLRGPWGARGLADRQEFGWLW